MNEVKEFELASFRRRFGAFIIDYLIIFLIWYMVTTKDLSKVNRLMETLDPEISGSLEIFVEAIFQLYIAFIFKWVIVSTVIFTVFPAIFGNGKSIGKLIFGICVVDDENFCEISPSKLMLREFVIKTLLETILIIPNVISFFMVIFRKDCKSIHDLLTHTIVIKSSYTSTY